jgi:hypothetical protein
MGFNGDTKMGVMLDDPAAKAVLVKFLPEINTAGPMLKLARGMTLKASSSVSASQIPPEKLQEIWQARALVRAGSALARPNNCSKACRISRCLCEGRGVAEAANEWPHEPACDA